MSHKGSSDRLIVSIVDALVDVKAIAESDFEKGRNIGKRIIDERKEIGDYADEQRLTTNDLANYIVDALIAAKIADGEKAQLAIEVAAEEINVFKAMDLYLPASPEQALRSRYAIAWQDEISRQLKGKMPSRELAQRIVSRLVISRAIREDQTESGCLICLREICLWRQIAVTDDDPSKWRPMRDNSDAGLAACIVDALISHEVLSADCFDIAVGIAQNEISACKAASLY